MQEPPCAEKQEEGAEAGPPVGSDDEGSTRACSVRRGSRFRLRGLPSCGRFT